AGSSGPGQVKPKAALTRAVKISPPHRPPQRPPSPTYRPHIAPHDFAISRRSQNEKVLLIHAVMNPPVKHAILLCGAALALLATGCASSRKPHQAATPSPDTCTAIVAEDIIVMDSTTP